MVRWILGWLILYNIKTLAAGAWYQEPQQITSTKNRGFSPEFVILKAGVFSTAGKLTLSPHTPNKKSKTPCINHSKSIAWITHRLSPTETLAEESGKVLGREISQKIDTQCFSAIELDIEPLKKAEPWLESFLKGVKTNLNPDLKLRLAIPILSPQTIDGQFWSLRDGVSAFGWVDGLDVMAYDSGIKSSKEYGQLFKNTFFFVMELNRQSPEKKIIMGLPAYDDQTKLHRKETENLETVLAVLKPFTPFQLKPYCANEIEFAYYAGWTLSAGDIEVHKQLEDWKNNVCKKSS